MIGINEHSTSARTLVNAAHGFLLEYVHSDGVTLDRHNELAAAATAVVFSASYVDSEAKHALLAAVHEKLKGKSWRGGLTPDCEVVSRQQ